MADNFVLSALKALPPERAHEMALLGLKLGFGPRAAPVWAPRLATRFAGLDLASPIGLAAGFDKNAEVPDAMLAAGFGWVECGTVTPLPQAGNARPRVFRLSEDRGVINRLGFNNQGLARFAERMQSRFGKGGVVGANVGANKDSADRAGDYVKGLHAVWPFASYVTANISSPNTPGLRGLQEKGALEDLLGRMMSAREALSKAHGVRPLFLKVAPDLDEQAIGDIVELALAYKLDALIVSNTTISRPEGLRSQFAQETGGLSGAPLLALSTRVLRRFAEVAQGRIALVGVGGIASGEDALAKIKAGASAVQLYSAMVFEGPLLAARITRELDALLEREGFTSVSDAVGADLR